MKNKGHQTNLGGRRAKLHGLFDIGAPDSVDEIFKSRPLSKEIYAPQNCQLSDSIVRLRKCNINTYIQQRR